MMAEAKSKPIYHSFLLFFVYYKGGHDMKKYNKNAYSELCTIGRDIASLESNIERLSNTHSAAMSNAALDNLENSITAEKQKVENLKKRYAKTVAKL